MELEQKYERVWQRMQGQSPAPDHKWISEMIAETKYNGAAYLHLSHHFSGKEGAMLRRMFEEEQSQISCLRGVYRLITGQRCQVHTNPIAPEDPSVALRRCYGREMRCLCAYEVHSGDTEYGPVFVQLAQQKKQHCKNILHLMGRLDLK